MQVTTTNKLPVTKQQAAIIARFKRAVGDMWNRLVELGQIYVNAVDEDPHMRVLFQQECPDINGAVFKSFEKIGRKQVHPTLMIAECTGKIEGTRARVLKNLPYALQAAVVSGERLDFLTTDGSTLKVNATEASKDQLEQLFEDGSVRTLSSQKLYIERVKREQQAKSMEAETLPYVITSGRVTFKRGTHLNKKEMRRILQEM